MLGFEMFKIKYEICEIFLCNVNEKLHDTGLTVMDGPFFSITPFGKTGYHSLTAVTFTPHVACKDALPQFKCQAKSIGFCSPEQLGYCNDCPAKPESAWPYMGSEGVDYNLLYALKMILYTLNYKRAGILILLANVYTFIKYKQKWMICLKDNYWLLIMACFFTAWFILIRNHSILHFTLFAWRALFLLHISPYCCFLTIQSTK